MFGKEAYIMRMLRSEDQSREIDEKLAVLWRSVTFWHSRTFDSSRSTKIYQGLSTRVSSRSRVNMIDKEADTMRMFRPMCRTVTCRQKPGQPWPEAFTSARSAADFTRRGWSMEFWLVVLKPPSIILNNQQCFDFSYWPGHSTLHVCSFVPTVVPDYHR